MPFYAWFLSRGRYDLVNIYFADCGEAAPIRRTKSAGGYRVQFIVGYPVELVPHRFDAFDRLGLTPLVDRIVAKSPAMEPGIRQRLGRPTVMIPNGVDTKRFDPDLFPRNDCRRELGLDPEAPVIVTVAALEERKGIQFVLRALPRLVQHRPGLRYFVAGEGPYQSALESEVNRLGLEVHVRFLGRVGDVRPWLGAADLVALLSHGEGLPNVMLEAWSMDLPVLVSQHPPYPDLMHDSLGRMVDESDVVQVGAGLDALIEPGNCPVVGARREHVAEHYSWRRVAQSIMEEGDSAA